MHNDKFNSEYINFINQNFNPNDHLFIFVADVVGELFPIPQLPNVIKLFCSRRRFYRYLLLAYYCIQADKIILHGLFVDYIIRFLYINRYLLKKCYWVIWGGDLYDDLQLDIIKTRKQVQFTELKKLVISKMNSFITYLKEDYNLAKEYYSSKAEYKECIMYLSNLFNAKAEYNKKNDTLVILVGNSATDTNNHYEVFNKILAENLDNYKILCPLNYGDKNYAAKVVELGTKLFGDKFEPLLDFIPLEQYTKLLSTVDVAIFNHNRQQGMGNIINLLGMGKLIYIRNDITTWNLLEHLNLKVYATNKNLMIRHTIKNNNYSETNKVLIKNYFNKNTLYSQWENIFDT